jgi:hypothetical protein
VLSKKAVVLIQKDASRLLEEQKTHKKSYFKDDPKLSEKQNPFDKLFWQLRPSKVLPAEAILLDRKYEAYCELLNADQKNAKEHTHGFSKRFEKTMQYVSDEIFK